MNALISNGLQIEFLNEIPYSVYNCFPNMKELTPGKFVYNDVEDRIPYLFSIRAEKRFVSS